MTYAGFENESELLFELYRRGLQQPLVGTDLYGGDGLLMFWSHVPIAPWQTPAWLTEMRRSLRPAQYLRMIENKFVTTESTFIDMSWWDACTDPQAKPVVQDRQLSIWVGIDASVKRDLTAIVSCSWNRDAKQVRLINHRIFQPSPDQPLDFELCVEHTILALKQRFNVRQVLYDPYQMQASAQRLKREGIKIEEFPQSVPNLTEASQNLYELIQGRNLVAYPDDNMRLAISRAIAVETGRGWRIAKEKQAHKVDVVIAMAMAALAAIKGQSTYDSSGRWIVDDGPPPEDPKIVKQRRDRLVQILDGRRGDAVLITKRRIPMSEQIIEITDRFGRRRRARRGEAVDDGETVHFGMQFMDAAVRDALAGKFGSHTGPRGYVRGFAVLDALRVERTSEDAAVEAYEERSARMRNAWRAKAPQQDAGADERTLAHTQSLDALRAAAEKAWEERNKRMSNAWRQRQEA